MMRGALRRLRTGWQRRRLLAPWLALADRAGELPPDRLAELRPLARQAWRAAERILFLAEARRVAPALPRTTGSDLAWRPDAWAVPLSPPGIVAPAPRCPLTSGTTLFHDGAPQAIILRQVRNAATTDLAPFGLRVEVFDLGGRFVSLSVDLPAALVAGLTRRHILRLEIGLTAERPQEVYARLNVGRGQDSETQTRHDAAASGDMVLEFDLAYARLDDAPAGRPWADKAWIDVILQDPHQNAVTIRDLVLSRRLRAEL